MTSVKCYLPHFDLNLYLGAATEAVNNAVNNVVNGAAESIAGAWIGLSWLPRNLIGENLHSSKIKYC